jgi:caa(3)-type oxidase subunit IV
MSNDQPHVTDISRVHIDRKEYWFIFITLFVLTVLEVGVVFVPGIPKPHLIAVLVIMALVKAALVGLFFMHLNHETKVVRWGVIIPLMLPFFYAAVLIADAIVRIG